MIATCIYCGHRVHHGSRHSATQQEAHQALIEHDRQCPKNPIAQELAAERERGDALAAHVERLRAALNYSSEYLYGSHLNTIGHGSKAHMEMVSALQDAPENSLAQRDAKLKDHESRCTTAVCCAWLARQNDFTAVEEILIDAGMTEPGDFDGCTQEDIEEIAALDLRRIRIKADEIGKRGEP